MGDKFLDLGEFAKADALEADFDERSHGPGFDARKYVTKLGDGVTRGDGPNADRASRHAESAELADALNRLSLNGEPGVADVPGEPGWADRRDAAGFDWRAGGDGT